MVTPLFLESRLHTSMHFFFSDLSLANSGYSSAVTPIVTAGLLTGDKVVSYNARAAQMFFFVAFASVEPCLLASVAYEPVPHSSMEALA